MPVHLYTLPTGLLPDASTVPDGYPHLIDNSQGGRTLLYNNNGTWTEVAPVGATAIPAAFSAVVPAKPVADGQSQVIDLVSNGAPGIPFFVPTCAAGNMPQVAEVQEYFLQTSGTHTPTDVVMAHLYYQVDTEPKTLVQFVDNFPVFYGPESASASTHLYPWQYDASATPFWAGTRLSAQLEVGPNYSSATDVTFLFTVWLQPSGKSS